MLNCKKTMVKKKDLLQFSSISSTKAASVSTANSYLIPHSHQLWVQDSQKKEKTNTSQMRLRSVFKMRTSILNTATTEQMGCIRFFFFRLYKIYKLVFIYSLEDYSSASSMYHDTYPLMFSLSSIQEPSLPSLNSPRILEGHLLFSHRFHT